MRNTFSLASSAGLCLAARLLPGDHLRTPIRLTRWAAIPRPPGAVVAATIAYAWQERSYAPTRPAPYKW